MEVGAGINLEIIAKFIPATLGLLETFQRPNGFIKIGGGGGGGGGGGLIFIPYLSHSLSPAAA